MSIIEMGRKIVAELNNNDMGAVGMLGIITKYAGYLECDLDKIFENGVRNIKLYYGKEWGLIRRDGNEWIFEYGGEIINE